MDSPEFASAPKELDRLLKTVANVHALPELVRKLSPLKQPKEKRLFAPVRAEPASNQICPSGRTETTRKMGITKNAIHNFVAQLLPNQDNRGNKEFKLSDTFSIVFPSNLLEVCESVEETSFFETEDFNWSQEFIPQRPSMPLSVNLMVTTLCNTSCCYCYANRSLTPLMSTVEIVDIIK